MQAEAHQLCASMARFVRSGGHFLKPEGALKRSDELLQVGQKNAALQTLHDVITSKRYRTWQKVHRTAWDRRLEYAPLLMPGNGIWLCKCGLRIGPLLSSPQTALLSSYMQRI